VTAAYATAAAVSAALSLAVWGAVARAAAAPSQRRWLLALGAALLPAAAATWLGLRQPLIRPALRSLSEALGLPPVADNLVFGLLVSMEAPVVEELAKLAPALAVMALGGWRARFLAANERRVPLGMALGLGFGLGEIGLLAWLFAPQAPAGIAWTDLGGFMGERFSVCLLHGAFTALAVSGIGRGWGRALAGLAAAMALHWGLNFPILLSQVGVFDVAPEVWPLILAGWVQLYVLGAAVGLFVAHRRRGGAARPLLGRARCPSCGAVYERPLLGVAMVIVRYERCAACGRRHWIGPGQLV